MSDLCPCGRLNARGQPLVFEACCGRYLLHDTPAPDAESLMRSRYSAYALARPAYVLSTWHESTRPSNADPEPGVKWLGLSVREHKMLDAEHAEVAFVARSRVAGRGHRMQERSRFVREQGRWFYVDGDVS